MKFFKILLIPFAIFLTFGIISNVFSAEFGKTQRGKTSILFPQYNSKSCSIFAATETGPISKLTGYWASDPDNATVKVRGIIYASSGGACTTRLGYTKQQIGLRSNSWNDLFFSSPIQVVKGKSYCLCVQADKHLVTNSGTLNTGKNLYGKDVYSDGASNPAGKMSYYKVQYPIYATYASSTETLGGGGYGISLSIIGNGSGNVTCNGGSCNSLFPNNSSVTIVATPATGSGVGTVSGSCSQNPCTITMDGSTKNITVTFDLVSVTCTSFTYSPWGACQSNNTQTRNVLSSSPSGCSGGNPVLSQSCTFTDPTCTSFTYSAWGACQSNNTQTRTVLTSTPNGCSGGNPVLTQSCTYVAPTYPINITMTGTGTGSVSCNNSLCSNLFSLGSLVSLLASSNTGSSFAGWGGACSGISGNVCNLTVGTTNDVSLIFNQTTAPTCTSFTYSAWGACQSNNTQTRTVATQSPTGCTGGSPILTQSCTYSAPTCTSFTYSAWGACQSNNTQTRSVTASSPTGCTGGSPVLSQSCTYTAPTCTSFTYSDWGACQSNNTQTRTVATQSPSGCSGGSPVLTQSCVYSTIPNGKFVAHNGDDINGLGTYDRPWKTLVVALKKLVPGDTLYVRGGPAGSDNNTPCLSEGDKNGACWRESITNDGVHSPLVWQNNSNPAGTAGNPITIAAYPGEDVIIEPSTCSNGVIYGDPDGGNSQCSYITFENLIIDARNCGGNLQTQYGEAVRFDSTISDVNGPSTGWCNNLTFKGGKVRHGKYVGGFHAHARDVVIDGVEIYENGAHAGQDWNGSGSGVPCSDGEHDHALYILGPRWTIKNSHIHDNIQAIQVWLPALGEDGNHQFLNNSIHDNQFNPWASQKWGLVNNGRDAGTSCKNGIGGQVAVFDRVGSKSTIKCNKIYNSTIEAGVALGGVWGNPASNNLVTNNWIWNNVSGSTGLQISDYGTGNTINNNINSAPAAGAWESCGGSSPSIPTISFFSALPATINPGGSATLSWTTSGATTISISGIGTVTGTSISVSPSVTTNYTLTASNTAGSATAQATVTVSQSVPIGNLEITAIGKYSANDTNNIIYTTVDTVEANQTIVAVIPYIGNTTVENRAGVSLSSSPSLIWTKRVSNSNTWIGTEIWTATASSPGTYTVTWTGGTGTNTLLRSITLYAIKGVAGFGTNGTLTNSTAIPLAVTVTPQQSGSILIFGGADDAAIAPYTWLSNTTKVIEPGPVTGGRNLASGYATNVQSAPTTVGASAPAAAYSKRAAVLEVQGGGSSQVTCTSFDYSAWGACQSNNTQTRTIAASYPAGCTGGNPVVTQSCTYIASSGNSYYVAHNGTDSAGRGTLASPFRTINYAIKNARGTGVPLAPGDTLYIRGGSSDDDNSTIASLESRVAVDSNTLWDEVIHWANYSDGMPSGSDESNRITIAAYCPGGVCEKVRLEPSSCAAGAIWIEGRNTSSENQPRYITFQDLIVDGRHCPTGNAPIRLEAYTSGGSTVPHHIKLVRIESRYGRGSGIMIYGGGDSFDEVIDSNIHHNGTDAKNHGHGIYIETNRNIVKGTASGLCRIHDNMSDAVQILSGWGVRPSYNTIENCDIYDNGQNSINTYRQCTQTGASGYNDYAYCFDGAGIYIPRDTNFPNCTCHTTNLDNVGTAGLYNGDYNTLDGNRIYNNRHTAVMVGWGSTYAVVKNNRIYGNSTAHSSPTVSGNPASGGIFLHSYWGSSSTSNVSVLDNLLWNNPANGNRSPGNQIQVNSDVLSPVLNNNLQGP